MKKPREHRHLSHFKEVCPFFPQGELEESESPDFIVHSGTRVVGIEHTEVFQPGPSHGESLQAQDSLAQRIVERAKQFYVRDYSRPLHVQVLFNPRAIASKLPAVISALILRVIVTPLELHPNVR
jgi:hypothetical protein